MNKPPEFDPRDPNAGSAGAGSPDKGPSSSPGSGDELPSLEALLRSAFPIPDNLAGGNGNPAPSIPESTTRFWEGPPLTEDSVLRGIASAGDVPGPANQPTDETAKPAKSGMNWLQPPEKIAERSTPRGRRTVKRIKPGLYGNLADTGSLPRDMLKDARSAANETPHQPARVEDAELKAVGSAGEAVIPVEIPPVAPANFTAAGTNKPQAAHDSPVSELEPADAVEPGLSADIAPPVEPPDATAAIAAEPQSAHQSAEEIVGTTEALSDQSIPLPSVEELARRLEDVGSPTLLTVADGSVATEAGAEPQLFQSFYKTKPRIQQPPRIPHLGHLVILIFLAALGLLGSSLLTRSALHFHLWASRPSRMRSRTFTIPSAAWPPCT